jgi:hypothetical protein
MIRFRVLAITLVAMGLARCSGHKAQVAPQPSAQTAAQLSALDEAYKSGVFTKEEYDAKKAALAGSAAVPPASAAPATAPTVDISPPPAAPVIPQAPASIPEAPISQPPAAAPVNSPPAPAAMSTPQPPPAVATPVPRPQATPVAPPPKPAVVAKAIAPERPEPEPAPSRGCEDAEYNAHKSGKQSRFFIVSLDRARKSTFSALANLGFTVEKDTGNEIEASRKSGGDREILHFDATTQGGKKGTKVNAETKKGSAGRAAQKSWTSAVLAQIACGLR